MITQTAIAVSASARQAEVIYSQARSQINVQLWRAALGADAQPAANATPLTRTPPAMTTLIGLIATQGAAAPTAPKLPAPKAEAPMPPIAAVAGLPVTAMKPASGTGLGNNARYAGNIASAAARTGIPAAALATIIDAESAKRPDGSWQVTSRNARSSAAGLGQFLSGTWKSEAERAGTWLNNMARDNGWIGASGKVLPAAQAALLGLRDNAEASINATADYASHSLDRLAAAGVDVGKTADVIARAAYLGHNLGVGDAVRFLSGGIAEGRARRLLDAQIGVTKAARQITEAGSATAAHRSWLLGFIAKHIDTDRFLK